MFEITRRTPLGSSIRDLMSWINEDPFFGSAAATWSEEGNLPIDVSEGDGEVIVRASLPGFRKEEVEVQVHNGVLSIKAEHTEVRETKDERYFRRERRFGAVSRRLALPGIVSEAEAKAELKDGILTLRIPHSEAARPKQIQVR